MERQTDRWADGCRKMGDRQKNGKMVRQLPKQMEEQTYRQTNRSKDRLIDVRQWDGKMEGQTDGRIERQTDGRKISYKTVGQTERRTV